MFAELVQPGMYASMTAMTDGHVSFLDRARFVKLGIERRFATLLTNP